MRILGIGLLIGLVIGAGCREKKKASAECASQIAELRVWLDGMWKDGFGSEIAGSTRSLVAVDVGPALVELDRSLAIELRGNQALLLGSRYELDDADSVLEMRKILAVEQERISGRLIPDAINLVAEPSTPWRAIRAVVEAASAAGWPRAAFVVGVPWRSEAPGPSSLDPAIAADKRQLGGAPRPGPSPLAREAFAGCPAAIERMESVDAELEALEQPAREPRFKRHLLSDLPDAIARCNCGADLASVRALYWKTIFGRETDLRPMAATVDLAPAGQPAAEIAAPDAAPWSRTNASILEAAAAGKPVRLAASRR